MVSLYFCTNFFVSRYFLIFCDAVSSFWGIALYKNDDDDDDDDDDDYTLVCLAVLSRKALGRVSTKISSVLL